VNNFNLIIIIIWKKFKKKEKVYQTQNLRKKKTKSFRKWYHGKKMKMFPPSTPLPHSVINPVEHRVATGHSEGQPAARVRTYPKQVNDDSLGVQETVSRIPSRRAFESTQNWVVFKAPISKLGSSQIVVILLVFWNCSERLRCWVAATSVGVCVWPTFSGCLRERGFCSYVRSTTRVLYW
jgi:hypothetical protein